MQLSRWRLFLFITAIVFFEAASARASLIPIPNCPNGVGIEGLRTDNRPLGVRRVFRDGVSQDTWGALALDDQSGAAPVTPALMQFYRWLGFQVESISPGISVHRSFPSWDQLNFRIAEYNRTHPEPIVVKFAEAVRGENTAEFIIGDWAMSGTISISRAPRFGIVGRTNPVFTHRLKMASALLLPADAIKTSRRIGQFLQNLHFQVRAGQAIEPRLLLNPEGRIALNLEVEVAQMMDDYTQRWRRTMVGYGAALAVGNEVEALKLLRAITTDQLHAIDQWVSRLESASPKWMNDMRVHVANQWSTWRFTYAWDGESPLSDPRTGGLAELSDERLKIAMEETFASRTQLPVGPETKQITN